MIDQTIILLFLILFAGTTLYLYYWKAKKEVVYKRDERWLTIQNKASRTANFSYYFLILVIAVGELLLLFTDINITFTLNRVFIYGLLFIGLHNTIELLALKYYDHRF